MTSVGVPDILTGMRLARAHHDVKSRMETAQVELITGEVADKVAATKGDPYRLYALDTEIARIDSRLPLLELAQTRSAGAQTALSNAQEALGGYATELLGFTTIGDSVSARTVSRDAEEILGQVMAALNVDVAGRHVFGGDDADGTPLGSVEELLSDVRRLYDYPNNVGPLPGVDGAPLTVRTGGTDVLASGAEALAHYFGLSPTPTATDSLAFGDTAPPALSADPGDVAEDGLLYAAARRFTIRAAGDYAADPAQLTGTHYTGGVNAPPSVELAAGERLDYAMPADDPAIRSLIMNLAVIVVAGEMGDGETMVATLDTAARGLIAADDSISDLRAQIGLGESRIENAIALNQAEKASFEQARGRMLGRDQYDVASELTRLESQLEMIYAMTARSTRLSLLNYL